MSKISDLINKLCHNGVESKKIKDICVVTRGRVISKNDLKENAGDYPVYSSQTLNGGVFGKINTYDFDGEYVQWTTDGANAGSIFYRTGQFSVTNVCGLLKIKEEYINEINTNYLSYILSSVAKSYVNYATSNPKLMSNVVENIKVPIPPLEIQEEIAKILDKLDNLETELKTNLEMELDARKKQYDYWRCELFSFDRTDYKIKKIRDLINKLCPNGVEYLKLSEIAEQFNGLSGKSKKDFENGNCKYITYTNIYNNPSTKLDVEDMVFVNDDERQNEIKYKDFLIAGSSENLEDSGMISVVTQKPEEKIYLNSFCFGMRLNNKYYEKCDANYLKHLFRNSNFRKEIIACSFGVTRYNLSKEKFLKIKVPIPPLEIQEEIAKILDKYEYLTKSIINELPYEIELRKKQYDYYKNILLSFEEEKI